MKERLLLRGLLQLHEQEGFGANIYYALLDSKAHT
jgi:hypothetical protein